LYGPLGIEKIKVMKKMSMEELEEKKSKGWTVEDDKTMFVTVGEDKTSRDLHFIFGC